MSVLATQVLRWSAGEREVLWHRVTGRHIPLDPRTLEMLEQGDPRMEALRRRLRSEFMLADGPEPDVAALIPVRSRLVLLFLEASALWAPVPEVRTAGGYGYREIALDPAELAAWRAINDSRNTTTVAARAGVHPYLVMSLLEGTTLHNIFYAREHATDALLLAFRGETRDADLSVDGKDGAQHGDARGHQRDHEFGAHMGPLPNDARVI